MDTFSMAPTRALLKALALAISLSGASQSSFAQNFVLNKNPGASPDAAMIPRNLDRAQPAFSRNLHTEPAENQAAYPRGDPLAEAEHHRGFGWRHRSAVNTG